MRHIFGGLLFVFVMSAYADTIFLDPTNFKTGNGVGGTCPQGTGNGACSPIYQGTELLGINNHFDLYFNSDGKDKQVGDEVLLIVAVPNDDPNHHLLSAGAISSAAEYDPLNAASGTPKTVSFGATPQAYGMSASKTGGFAGLFTSGDIYSFLGGDLSHINNSEQFTNWTGALSTVLDMHNIENFGVYIWSIDTSTFSGGDALVRIPTM